MGKNFDELKNEIISVLKQHDVTRASLAGFFVHGELKNDGEPDVLVEFKGGKSLLHLFGLKIDLEEKLGRPVTVLTFDSMGPELKDSVKEQIALF